MLRGGRVCALVAVTWALAAPAQAAPWPEPERPVSRPSFVDVDIAGYTGMGYDWSPDATGLAVRASALAGSARPLWLWARGSYLVPLEDGPQLIQADVMVGRSVWQCDCAMFKDGEPVIQAAVRGPDAQGKRVVRAWSARRPAGAPRTLRMSADLVATAGARMLFFLTDNPDGTHTGEVFVPQAGVWYHQEHLLAGQRGRLRVALLGAYEYRSEAWGVFAHAEAALGRVHVALEGGGMSTDWGARELSLSLGYEL